VKREIPIILLIVVVITGCLVFVGDKYAETIVPLSKVGHFYGEKNAYTNFTIYDFTEGSFDYIDIDSDEMTAELSTLIYEAKIVRAGMQSSEAKIFADISFIDPRDESIHILFLKTKVNEEMVYYAQFSHNEKNYTLQNNDLALYIEQVIGQ
jgi:hypothetical protein